MKKHIKHFIYGAIAGIILLIFISGCPKIIPREYIEGAWDGGICELGYFFSFPFIILRPFEFIITPLIWIYSIFIMAGTYGIIFMAMGALYQLNKHTKHFIYGAITGITLLMLSFSCSKFIPEEYIDGTWEGSICELTYPFLFPFLSFRQFVPSTMEWISPIFIMAISYGIIFVIIGTLYQLLHKYKK